MVTVNGTEIGVCISTPYTLEVPAGILRIGENTLDVNVVSTLNHTMPDMFSIYVAEEPVGWSGEAALHLG